ncbi:maleylacetoacetate isomerase [Sphingomonas carotinifaciens]|uniref:Maleylacetoacetate isomerase n=1 Tax=Sphingomonas carotinifaciens TaxID=1166323 RepID=A0A1G7PZ35_9SPHN|nr:maleylacetoacetate isomerase [Sphingomonas carotinifaciens]MBB4087568.1 maleylpyruvate isomerase [Sphingomonas carotinifaciens]MWC45652.1 maleylacetoacetate isomerase [Sphingomonas carotinifaciens]SDF91483.1 maleylpyruvate isomerase [Sphingomonas carotinifaciens]
MTRLHDYWRSGASYRVRIALNVKEVRYEQVPHDLRTGEQRRLDYAAANPQKLVPALQIDDGSTLTQSLAILEWLEERHPYPALLPSTSVDRAIVRAMAGLIVSDIHPLNNLRVLDALRGDLNVSDEQVGRWIARWMTEGFEALEALVSHHGGAFAFGDTVTFADCCIVPQLYSAERFGVPLSAFPRLVAVGTAARALPSFDAAHPDRQPDADRL